MAFPGKEVNSEVRSKSICTLTPGKDDRLLFYDMDETSVAFLLQKSAGDVRW
jgi:hypothetical protein